jgi:hypothetical protein
MVGIHFLLPEKAPQKVGMRTEKRLSILGVPVVGWVVPPWPPGTRALEQRENSAQSAAESSGPTPPKTAASLPFHR